MRVARYERGNAVWFTLEDLDAAGAAAAERLGFRRMLDGGWRKSFPAGTPLLDRAWHNLNRYAEAMLAQAAARAPAPWADALDALCVRAAGLDWWLTGSAAMAVRGVAGVEPGDLDLVVSDADARRMGEALADHLVEPVAPADWFCRWWGRAFLCHTRVEWMGGVGPGADAPSATDFGPAAAAGLETVSWHGRAIRVPPLALQRAVSARRGFTERVAAIDGHLRGAVPLR